MGSKDQAKASDSAKKVENLSDDQLDEVVGGIGGAHESSERTDAITRMIKQHVDSQS